MKAKKKYWHVIKTKNSIRVSPKETNLCSKVKNSVSCFSNREGAIRQANTMTL